MMDTILRAEVSGPGAFDGAGQQRRGELMWVNASIPNISLRERRKRLGAGAVQMGIGLAVLAALIVTRVSRWWRLGLLVVFWGASAGFFQWREKT